MENSAGTPEYLRTVGVLRTMGPDLKDGLSRLLDCLRDQIKANNRHGALKIVNLLREVVPPLSEKSREQEYRSTVRRMALEQMELELRELSHGSAMTADDAEGIIESLVLEAMMGSDSLSAED